MNKFILSSFLLLLLLEIVYSEFNIITNNDNFIPSTELRGFYSQQNNNVGGYHKAEIYFNTKIPSLNLGQNGITNIVCDDDNKITISLNDRNIIKQFNNWPDKVMLLISHKWNCFGETTTQFFMVKNKFIDTLNKKVSFITERCDVSDWSNEFIIDLSWVNGNKKRAIPNRRLNKRYFKGEEISLNVLFDETTGLSSNPNLPLLNDSNISLFCTNCYMRGEATISARISYNLSGFSKILTDATISVNGSTFLNLDFFANSTVGDPINFNDKIASIGLSPFSLPGIFNIGPSIDLIASTTISTNISGSLTFGGEINLPNFNVNATFINITHPTFSNSGFNPLSKLHIPNFDFNINSANIIGSLKPQLSFGIDIFPIGNFLSKNLGFEIVGTLNNIISFDNFDNLCIENNQPRLNSNLTGNLDFFVSNNNVDITNVNILNFTSVNLLDKCL
ncbi:hypothetical protein C1645_834774 [Glomus cerebriforme]|uniref:DUF7223 domain-containing protein n=1 Tax=Glomus cerebriforme TaxID=658196 RepID=A0A397SJU3_9GLOM|nr:hypothetical protein C1645_834774 [Glomus cerebriforme]